MGQGQGERIMAIVLFFLKRKRLDFLGEEGEGGFNNDAFSSFLDCLHFLLSALSTNTPEGWFSGGGRRVCLGGHFFLVN